MPGLNLVCKTDPLQPDIITGAHADLLYRDAFTLTKYRSESTLAISSAGYKDYPVKVYDQGDVLILIEGVIYNASDHDLESRLLEVARDVMSHGDYEGRIKDCVDTFDGEYLVLIYIKQAGDLLIFNDRWARMPVFYAIVNDGIILSRELKFVLHWLPRIEFDRKWMVEFLAFEYNLGDKSLVEAVRTMKPSMLIHIARMQTRPEVTRKTLRPANFDRTGPGMPRATVIEKCAELFTASLVARVRRMTEGGFGIAADLSGGHDSRAVFAGLMKLGAEFVASNNHLVAGDEADIAKQIARLYGKDLVNLNTPYPDPTVSDLRRILYVTDCLVDGYTSFMGYHSELEREGAFGGRHAHFMGLGGEFLRHRYRPMKRFGDVVRMIDEGYFTTHVRLDDGCRLVHLHRDEFSANLARAVSDFGDASVEGRIKHLNFERYNKFDNGGENRHRMFAWVVAPFWGKDLFEFNMQNIPVEWIDFHFFTAVLRAIDPRTLEVPIYAGIMGINPLRRFSAFNVKVKLKTWMRTDPVLLTLAKRVVYRSRKQSVLDGHLGNLAREALTLCQGSDILSHYFDPDALTAFLKSPRTDGEFYQLLTLILYIAEVEARHGSRVVSA